MPYCPSCKKWSEGTCRGRSVPAQACPILTKSPGPPFVLPLVAGHEGELHVADTLPDTIEPRFITTFLNTRRHVPALITPSGFCESVQKLASKSLRDLDLSKHETLGNLYRLFVGCPAWKKLALDSYRSELVRLRVSYRQAKSITTKAMYPPPHTIKFSPKPWAETAARAMKGIGSAKYEGVAERVRCVRLGAGFDWMRLMTQLVVLRKKLNATYAERGGVLRHLTVLSFEGLPRCFSLLVCNEKTERGGTTRMLLPVPWSENLEKDARVRVLDMTYGDVWSLISNILLPLFEKESDLAEALLDILRGSSDPQFLYGRHLLTLGHWSCSFLYGASLGKEALRVHPDWELSSKKSRKKADLSGRSAGVTAYAAMSYVLSILFLAEPRHALGMWHATWRCLELVRRGRLSFAQLFDSLGAIKYGRLLPGANVLGPPLIHQRQLKRLAMPLVDSVVRDPDTDETLPSPMRAIMIEAKMTWGVGHTDVPFLRDTTTPILTKAEYQPLFKVLFVEFLALLDANRGNVPYQLATPWPGTFTPPDAIEGEEEDYDD